MQTRASFLILMLCSITNVVFMFSIKSQVSHVVSRKRSTISKELLMISWPSSTPKLDALQSHWKTIKSTLVTGAVVTTLLSNSGIAHAQLPASELFSQAEIAIENTQKEFKTLENEWKEAKKSVLESQKDIELAIATIQTVETELIKLQSSVEDLLTTIKSSVASIQKEIDVLRVSTGEKYELAQESAFSGAKPQVTAKLFLTAQNEAALLIEDGKILKSLQSTDEAAAAAVRKASESVNSVRDSLTAFNKALEEHVMGYNELTEGVAKGSQSLNGGPVFRKGLNDAMLAQEKYNKAIRSLAKDIRTVQLLEEELTNIDKKLSADVIGEEKSWESTSKLRLKQAAISTKAIEDAAIPVTKSGQAALDHILEASNAVSRSQFTKNGKQAKRDELDKLLKVASVRLDTAEKNGKDAERLLLSAKKQGEKEASVYLKYYQYSKAATVPAASTNTAKK